MYDRDEKKFKYPYDFSDQATMCIFDESDYKNINELYTSRIKKFDLQLEGNFVRMNEVQRKIWECETINNFNINELQLNPFYDRLNSILKGLEKDNYILRQYICDMQQDYHDLVVKKYEDKHVPDWFNPINISVKDDLIVSSGLDIIGSQITNRTVSRWSYFHIGESGQGASMDQQALKAPIAAYPVSQIGSFTAVGDQIRFFGSIPSTLRNVEIREIGLSTRLLGGFLLNRSTYPQNDPLKHVTNKTYPVATIVIYMTSDAAFSTKA